MRCSIRPAALLGAALLLGGCATSGALRADAPLPAPDSPVAFEVFLLGNTAGAPGSERAADAVLAAVAAEAARAGEASAVVLLGDQTRAAARAATRAGLPDSLGSDPALARLAQHLARVPGRVVAVPGDRDWAAGRDGLRRQARALEAAFGREVLLPADASGGPAEVELADGLVLFAVDTAWWLRDAADRPAGEAEGENVRAPADVVALLDAALARADDARRIVVGHHPLRSVGEHAGFRTLGRALPTLGLASLADQTLGLGRQSLAAPRYRRLRAALDATLARHDGVVYASAHDHSLQAFEADRTETLSQTLLVSGTAGGHVRGVARGYGAHHAVARPGYQHLVYHADGRLRAETVLVDPASGARTVAARWEIAEADPGRGAADAAAAAPTTPRAAGTRAPETRTQAAHDDFAGPRIADGPLRRVLWGRGYRDVWQTPVTFPVLDLDTLGGGLTPVRLGGGQQTTTLRLDGADGRTYELRLVEKSGLAGVPAALRRGAVGDVVLDLRSAVNPYAPLVTGPLAEAAGVLSPYFALAVVPDSPRLGPYRALFAGRLAHVSVRPDGDVSDVPGLRGAADVVSEGRFYREITDDQDHRADAAAVLRARLLDQVLADWDRHAGQWRWAAYEPGELDPTLVGDDSTRGKVYRPVARDRDFAFHDVRGLVPALISRFGDRRLQPFRGRITRARYLNQNGFPQDRRLLAWLSREDVAAEARRLQAALTDGALAAAVDAMPPEIRAAVGERTRRTLAARRDDLPRAADAWYRGLARTVDLVGTDRRERFAATRHADGRLTVAMIDAGRGDTLGVRTFRPGETREVRLHGLGGRDVFEIAGTGPARITVRVVGGRGRDSVAAASRAIVHDTPEGMDVGGAGRLDLRLDADDARAHVFDPLEPAFVTRSLLPVVGVRATDGVVLGASHTWLVPGYRQRPWAARHVVRGSVATATGGLEAAYAGLMRDAALGLDLDVNALASTPRYVRNFYGLGNATPDVGAEAARLELAQARLAVGLGRAVGEGVLVAAGPAARWARPEAPPAALVPADGGAAAGVDFGAGAVVHAGAFARAVLSTADPAHAPRQGVRLTAGAAAYGGASAYGQLRAEAAAYAPVGPLGLAVRAGADHRVGTFPFFDAAVLGGAGTLGAEAGAGGVTLRGLPRERFAGRTAASASAEARLALFTLPTYLVPLRVGALAFADAGRVWGGTGPESGGRLQTGLGGGLWVEAFDRAAASAHVARSGTSTIVTVGAGFPF